MPPPFRVVSTEQMRALERAAAEQGIDESSLQDRAGREIAAVVQRELRRRAGPVLAVAGPGNNGRDAMLAARFLAGEGRTVLLYLGPRHAVQPTELEELDRLGVAVAMDADAARPLYRAWLRQAAVVIDGLLGIGIKGAMRPPLAELAQALNAARASLGGSLRVVSVDVPSGLDSDSGQADGTVVQADVTVALGAVKTGCLRSPGISFAGTIEPRPIGLPPGLTDPLPVSLLDLAQAAALLPSRPLEAHKGSLGSVLVVGGSGEYVGAPILAAMGAARSGCGLVGLAVPRHVQLAAAARLPEATYVLLPGDGAETDLDATLDMLKPAMQRFDVLVLGPGLGRGPGAHALVRTLLGGFWPAAKPAVVDADALNVLAVTPDWHLHAPRHLVLTPHLGEMLRLSAEPKEDLLSRSWELAQRYAALWNQVLLLKGALSVVAEPTGAAWVSPWANPALATAGSGDVLSGAIAGLLAQGLGTAEAARLGVALQAWAARAVLAPGRTTLLASEVADQIPAALGALSRSSEPRWPRPRRRYSPRFAAS